MQASRVGTSDAPGDDAFDLSDFFEDLDDEPVAFELCRRRAFESPLIRAILAFCELADGVAPT
jgi:hypothetical protein